MKRYIIILLTVLFIGSSYIIVRCFGKENSILIDNKNISYRVLAGGLKNARDFATDGKNIFIAFKDRIQLIEENGKSYIIMEDNKADISSLEFYKENLYFLNKSSFMSFDLEKGSLKELMSNIPNFGDYGEGVLMEYNGEIYITIGSATNSGIVGEDNEWRKQYPFNYDITPKDIVISDSVNRKTGAFVPYNTKNISGQKMPGHFPGNASVITYNVSSGETSLFCWGIRNIKGIDFDSEGKIFSVVGGMEPRGGRAVKGDSDYIYELKKSIWYGWPDYSGGDPINSPRFKGSKNEKISFLLQMHPSTNPPAPLYQHKSLASLAALALDKRGVLGSKDSIIFYDNMDNIVYSLDKKGVLDKKFKLDKSLRISSIKASENSIMVLEEKAGYLIELHSKEKAVNSNTTIILIYVVGLIIIVSGLLVWKMKD